jgi:hypothetical protein
MATDLRLDDVDGNYVVIDSGVLKSTAADFLLDNPSRHTGTHHLRRALVHDQRDGLTINFNSDYPGGVTINDVVALHNRFSGINIYNVREISAFGAATHGGTGTGGTGTGTGGMQAGSLVLRGEILIDKTPATSPGHQSDTISLHAVLTQLQDRVQQLSNRIAELEQR